MINWNFGSWCYYIYGDYHVFECVIVYERCTCGRSTTPLRNSISCVWVCHCCRTSTQLNIMCLSVSLLMKGAPVADLPHLYPTVELWQICHSFNHKRDSVADLPHLYATVELCRSVTARIGFSVDSDLHEKLLCRIGSRWCKNHVESDLNVFVSVQFFLFSVQNEFVVGSKKLSPILHGETVI